MFRIVRHELVGLVTEAVAHPRAAQQELCRWDVNSFLLLGFLLLGFIFSGHRLVFIDGVCGLVAPDMAFTLTRRTCAECAIANPMVTPVWITWFLLALREMVEDAAVVTCGL